jgi:N-acetylmuramoyl-L-alanine amidase
MTDAEVIASLNTPAIVALTLYGEARNERIEGLVAVACVIRNRVNAGRFGADYRDICLAPWQFSCWKREGGEANHAEVLKAARSIALKKLLGPALRECVWVADGAVGDILRDVTRKSTHYMTRQLWETKPPKWAIGRTPAIGIGAHVFFNDVQ